MTQNGLYVSARRRRIRLETVAKEVTDIVVGAVIAGLHQGKGGSLQALNRARAEIKTVLLDWLNETGGAS